MDKRSRINLILRTILFFSALIIFIDNPNNIYKVLNYNIIFGIKVYQICWIYLVNDILKVIIPYKSKKTYNGKLFLKHYKEKNNYNKNKMLNQTSNNNKNAFNVFLAWIGLNFILFYIYFKLNLSKPWLIMLFLFYFWADMVCVNIWCPFQVIFMKNRCCNTCRIYNWDHIMYFTPFILIPNIYTYSLIILSIISLLQWEYNLKKYPERFSNISNLNLTCANCKNECRFNKRKTKQIKKSVTRYKYER
ncbi:MAG: hypothetical protein Q4E31_02980 [Intestinibacter bartlettii]|uniref:hypothetical protein n=1 Tax=Intestinibacter bartlettii TaxID=261299 RepID=UPI0026EF805C|nr:hypothetical protein [Intestinibacter bartlettii]MDO5009765.1 hypothetical protein [Intestinibacter bartlettii]